MTVPSKNRLRYASAGNPKIAAALNGLFEFTTQARAEAKLMELRKHFTVTRGQDESIPGKHLILWVKDYEITPEEEEKGYLGNYVCLRVSYLKDQELWSLHANKIERELKNHPLRKRPQARCPNWGHPVLRGVLKGATYATLEEANASLKVLHHEFPETTIPGENKLYVMIFSRRTNPKKPIQKYVLKIQNQQGGGFIIISELNEYKGKEAPKKVKAEGQEKLGHFASMVSLKKRRKKND